MCTRYSFLTQTLCSLETFTKEEHVWAVPADQLIRKWFAVLVFYTRIILREIGVVTARHHATKSQFVASGFVLRTFNLHSRSFYWICRRGEMSRAMNRNYCANGHSGRRRANSEAARHARLANRSAAENRFDPHDRQHEVARESTRSRVRLWRANFTTERMRRRAASFGHHLATRDTEQSHDRSSCDPPSNDTRTRFLSSTPEYSKHDESPATVGAHPVAPHA